jgi:ribosomal protein S18 acetylase RimI-like enzyme
MKFSATTGEVDEAAELMREVTQWCIDSGRPMWPLSAVSKSVMLQNHIPDNFVVGKVNGEPACAMILTWYDPEYWPNAKHNEAGYIHKLCVRRKFAGQQLPWKIFEYAMELCRERNANYLRLDTYTHSDLLRSMYRNLGFVEVGVVIPKDGVERTQLEIAVKSLPAGRHVNS